MEPTQTPESLPVEPSMPEVVTPDMAPEGAPSNQERVAPKGDRPSQAEPPSQSVQLPQPIVPAPTIPQKDVSLDAHVSSSSPVIADDVDVIEKEWVEKAKSIVNENKHDPYIQENKASKLQADYLKKRYGKTVKTVE